MLAAQNLNMEYMEGCVKFGSVKTALICLEKDIYIFFNMKIVIG